MSTQHISDILNDLLNDEPSLMAKLLAKCPPQHFSQEDHDRAAAEILEDALNDEYFDLDINEDELIDESIHCTTCGHHRSVCSCGLAPLTNSTNKSANI